jgi:predicted acetyltransferase
VTGQGLDIRALREDDGHEAEIDLQHRAFGPISAASRALRIGYLRDAVAEGRLFGAFDGPRLVGSAGILDMRQWWHGASLPMAGVATVKVAPEDRGRGVGKALMTELLGVIGARGYPVSALFPATAALYRSLGWEVAGARYEMVLPGRSLGSLLPPDGRAAGPPPELRRAGPGDAAQVIALSGRLLESARHCGPNMRGIQEIGPWLGDSDVFAYLAPDGFLAYGWQGDKRTILVDQLLAGSAETTRAGWRIVASHATQARTVRAWVGPDDPIAWLTTEPEADLHRHPWMLRLVDAAAAISARGFPAAAGASVTLRVDDTARPANSGLWKLEVSGGRGFLTPLQTARAARLPAAGPLSLGARGLAALYGGTPLDTLRRAGLVSGGDPGADEALDGAFAGPSFMLDDF